MSQVFTAAVQQEDDLFVARALEVEVASQGESIDEALDNLREALKLLMEDSTVSIGGRPLVTTVEIGSPA